MFQTIKELLDLRKVRNTCNTFMTRDRSRIGILRQFIWYVTVYKPRNKKGLMKYCIGYNAEGEPIAYSLYTIDGEKQWLTGGVIPKYRRLGAGKQLFIDLIKTCTKTPWLEVLRTNTSAIKLYKSIGFMEVKRNTYILIMKYEN